MIISELQRGLKVDVFNSCSNCMQNAVAAETKCMGAKHRGGVIHK